MKRIIYGFLACLGIACYDLSSASELELKAIVPDHGGLTLQKSPVLYYFISEPTTLPVRFTLIESRTDHVVVDMLLRSPDHSGFWPVRLEDYGIVLDPGVEYRWFVTIIKNADTPKKDIVSGGIVECCPDHLTYDAPTLCKRADTVLASYGIWYDAFVCLGELRGMACETKVTWLCRRS